MVGKPEAMLGLPGAEWIRVPEIDLGGRVEIGPEMKDEHKLTSIMPFSFRGTVRILWSKAILSSPLLYKSPSSPGRPMHPQGHYVKSVGPTQCVDRTLVGLGDSSLGMWEGRTSVRVLGSGQYHGGRGGEVCWGGRKCFGGGSEGGLRGWEVRMLAQV